MLIMRVMNHLRVQTHLHLASKSWMRPESSLIFDITRQVLAHNRRINKMTARLTRHNKLSQATSVDSKETAHSILRAATTRTTPALACTIAHLKAYGAAAFSLGS